MPEMYENVIEDCDHDCDGCEEICPGEEGSDEEEIVLCPGCRAENTFFAHPTMVGGSLKVVAKCLSCGYLSPLNELIIAG
jgi:hypothetical protein